ncbi:MAG: restriction endonuclease [Caldilineaceae bacterium SB0665_bin_25]|nr:restriction endonuclease [Caldilineaceae bacterium SB0665_bin_25]
MPIPTMFDLTLPVLELLGDGEIYHNSVLADQLAQRFNLTEAERNERTSSGQRRFANRISWARIELKNAVLLEYTRPGTSRITDRGRQVLVDKPHRIDRPFLSKFEEYRHTQSKDINGSDNDSPNGEDEDTPEENLKAAYETIRSCLANEIIEIVRNCSPSFFEQLVVDVLVGMGYGGSREEAGKAVGGSNDGGIDGIINEDRLGLDVIYIQAKRWENSVAKPEIQKFAGALAGQKAGKGVFITTSSFTSGAQEYIKTVGTRIILMDGRQLADFMIDYNVGVTTEATYELKRIDAAYFEDE